MLYPAPELPDDTSVENVRFATRIRNALNVGGLKTIGEVREASDAALLSLPDFGSSSLSYLREDLGLPSTDGVRPKSKKPTRMAPRFLTILTGRNVPKIGQPREPEPSIINEKTIADFTRVVEQTGILGSVSV